MGSAGQQPVHADAPAEAACRDWPKALSRGRLFCFTMRCCRVSLRSRWPLLIVQAHPLGIRGAAGTRSVTKWRKTRSGSVSTTRDDHPDKPLAVFFSLVAQETGMSERLIANAATAKSRDFLLVLHTGHHGRTNVSAARQRRLMLVASIAATRSSSAAMREEATPGPGAVVSDAAEPITRTPHPGRGTSGGALSCRLRLPIGLFRPRCGTTTGHPGVCSSLTPARSGGYGREPPGWCAEAIVATVNS
jgi:hypothetical protein